MEQSADVLYPLTLNALEARVKRCKKCGLSDTRTNVVFGEGDPAASIMLVGEGPGQVEDAEGRPFVGPAGQKLDEVLTSVGISRDEIYITNIVKCRPPNNRVPNKGEMAACSPYLEAQIALINPGLIITLGNTSTRWFIPTAGGITSTHGNFLSWRGGIKIFPMYHPSYLLRYPSRAKGSPKYQTWLDIKRVKEWLDEHKHTEGKDS
ncbi:MAG: uracil-DNA glycosylase [Candidatus Bipolaricaulota bacterium]|nr:uracil-DNA glycosylase [Candidatus Bipolaricaulota bacterium]